MLAGPRAASASRSERSTASGGDAARRLPVVGRLVRSGDFERVLRTRSRAQSVHFAIHHVPGLPSTAWRRPAQAEPTKLSTERLKSLDQSVDDSQSHGLQAALSTPVHKAPPAAPERLWLGAVVPKRHARRAVTRSQLKRQIRSAVQAHAAVLAGGLWVVRLRSSFDRATFPSAASEALKNSVRDELQHLLARVALGASGR